MKYLLLLLIVITLSCSKKDQAPNPIGTCRVPTEIIITNDSGGLIKVSLVNTDSSSIRKVIWVVSSADKSYTIETNGKIDVKQLFVKGGEFYATAIVETACSQSITLTRTTSIQLEPISIIYNTYVDSEDSLVTGIATSDGGYLLVGRTQNYLKGVVYNINAKGERVWRKYFGMENSYYSQLVSINYSNDGGYLLGGSSRSTSTASIDFWVIKINIQGDKLWEKFYGGGDQEILSSVIKSNDGGYLLGGRSASNKSGDKSENSRGQFDYWIVKIGSNGLKEWDKTFGGSWHDVLTAMSITSDGYLLTGTSGSNNSSEKSENNRGYGGDFWTIKINHNGDKLWDRTTGGNGDDEPSSILALNDGSVLIGGYSGSTVSGEKTETKKGETDYWIVKLNSQGQKLWDKTITGISGRSNQLFLDMFPTKDGNVLLAGFSNSVSDIILPSPKLWIVQIDTNGVVAWSKYFENEQIFISGLPRILAFSTGTLFINEEGQTTWL